MSNEQLPSAPTRRWGIVTIGQRRYRVREPPPRKALQAITKTGTLAGPWLRKVLEGNLVVYKPAQCPICKTEGQAEGANERWCCKAVVDGQLCGHVWDKEPITGEDGKPERFGISYVLGQRDLRAAFAWAVEQQIKYLDADALIDLAETALVGWSDYEVARGSEQWVTIRSAESLDAHLPNGMAILHLLRGAMEHWILPSMVDDWPDTAPGSSTSKTQRGDGPPGTDGASPAQPSPHAGSTRVPPPVRRHG